MNDVEASSRQSSKNRSNGRADAHDPKAARAWSLFGDGFSLPGVGQKTKAAAYLHGTTLSPLPVQRSEKDTATCADARGGLHGRRASDGSSNAKRAFGSVGLSRSPSKAAPQDGSRSSLLGGDDKRKGRQSWLSRQHIKFECPHGDQEPQLNDKACLDEDAISHHMDAQKGSHAHMAHADTSLGSSPAHPAVASSAIARTSSLSRRSRRGSTRESKSSLASVAPALTVGGAARALRNLGIFARCSDEFLGVLASLGEIIKLSAGESREVTGSRKRFEKWFVQPPSSQMRSRAACATVMLTGSCRVEVHKRIIFEGSPGCAYGLANLFDGMSHRTNNPNQQAVDQFTLRACVSEGCRCLILNTTVLRQAFAQCPHDQSRLQDFLRMLSRPTDSAQQVLSIIQCGESAKQAVIDGSTRHVFAAGEVICAHGSDKPMGLVFVRNGTVAIDLDGIEVRRISGGQVIGEEMLCNASSAWGFSASCVTDCDVQILQRNLFLPLIRSMQNSAADEKGEFQRLLDILDGQWKENRAILSWPLFRGYDAELVLELSRHIETRLVLSGGKIWEGGATGFDAMGTETALYFILAGSCEETCFVERGERVDAENMVVTEIRKMKRRHVQGACIGSREFLGIREKHPSSVIAKAICLLAVLHRNVFLHVLDGLSNEQKKLQSEEVAQVLAENLNSKRHHEPSGVPFVAIAGEIPLFSFCDNYFVDRVAAVSVKLFTLPGQRLCYPGVDMDAMFFLSRGGMVMLIDDIEIRRYRRTDAVSALAFCAAGFVPSFELFCESISEVWSVHRKDFLSVLDSNPGENTKLSRMTKAKLVVSHKEEESGGIHGVLVPLASLEIFRGCSRSYLEWVASRLEIAIYFPKQVIISEGNVGDEDQYVDKKLYIICDGEVLFSNNGREQDMMVGGNCFGERRLLGIAEHVDATVEAIEITILQVLHYDVFKRSLEFFPEEVLHFEKVMLARITEKELPRLSGVPFFSGCSEEFCYDVEKLMVTSCVQKGRVIVEGGSTMMDGFLYVLQSGSADAEDSADDAPPPSSAESNSMWPITKRRSSRGTHVNMFMPSRFPERSVINADVALGMVHHTQKTVKAASACAVARISANSFLNVLERFPSEVTRLVCRADQEANSSAANNDNKNWQLRLWPTVPSSVPLFSDVTIGFFDLLMEISDWEFRLPEQQVVKQGQQGNLMYILCYGNAHVDIDGIHVGCLVPGDCFGQSNFFGLCTQYVETLVTLTVSHFRRLQSDRMDALIHDIPGLSERFRQVRQHVRQATSDETKAHHRKVEHEKLRKRRFIAFTSHVSTVRNTRGVRPHASSTHACATSAADKKNDEHTKEDLASSTGSESHRRKGPSSLEGSRIHSRRHSAEDWGFSAEWVSLDTKNKQISFERGGVSTDDEKTTSSKRKSYATGHSFKAASFMQRMREKKVQRSGSKRFSVGSDSDDESDCEEAQPPAASRRGSAEAAPSRRHSVQAGDGAATSMAGRRRRAAGVSDYLPGMVSVIGEKTVTEAAARMSICEGSSANQEPSFRRASVLQGPGSRRASKLLPGRSGFGLRKANTTDFTTGTGLDFDRIPEADTRPCSAFSDVSSDDDDNHCMKSLNRKSHQSRTSVLKVENPFASLGGLDEPGGAEKAFFAKMQAYAESKKLTKIERIEAAISVHSEVRYLRKERAKVLRALHSGKWFKAGDEYVPPVFGRRDGDGSEESWHEKINKAVDELHLARADDKALVRKFKQLTQPLSSCRVGVG